MAVVQYKTPGVYIEENDAFPPSIVGVETAVPVFIGYTERADKSGRTVKLQPVRIGSMVDYGPIFGGAFEPHFTATDAQAALDTATTNEGTASSTLKDAVARDKNAKKALRTANAGTDAAAKATAKTEAENAAKALKQAQDAHTDTANRLRSLQFGAADFAIGDKHYAFGIGDKLFILYNSLRLFYANGGGDCYVVSVGDYEAAGVVKGDLEKGLNAVRDLVGPTMLVIPEATLLDRESYKDLVAEMLTQCQTKQDRVAILDVWGVDKLPPNLSESDFADSITSFREGLSAVPSGALKYGMAYTPFVKTSVIDPVAELDYTNFAEFQSGKLDVLTRAFLGSANALYPDPPGSTYEQKEFPGLSGLKLTEKTQQIADTYFALMADAKSMEDGPAKDAETRKINQGLTSQLPVLKEAYTAMAAKLGTLPPSAAMAGVYTRNDALRGVWNAPANVGLVSVIAPAIKISNKMQDDLNVPINGLAVNAIRDFVGRGTLVWGARTLDGNSNDWRYIQVRRALIYIEQSIELALNKFVFEPNVAQTWVTVSSMVGSFLRGVWQAGGLMGASPQEAFSIQCGLGSTMTAQDVLEGRMIVLVKLQMVRPAEFIILTFQQQMQGGAA